MPVCRIVLDLAGCYSDGFNPGIDFLLTKMIATKAAITAIITIHNQAATPPSSVAAGVAVPDVVLSGVAAVSGVDDTAEGVEGPVVDSPLVATVAASTVKFNL